MSRNPKNASTSCQVKFVDKEIVTADDSSIQLKTDKPPENLFQLLLYLLNKIGGRFGTALIVGIVVCGGLFFIWGQIPEQIKLSILSRLLSDSSSNTGLYPGVEIDKNTLSFDFAEWTPVPPGGDPSNCCKVTTDQVMQVRRVRSDANYLALRAGTSGKPPVFTSLTHQVSYKKSDDQRVSGPAISHYDVLLDISKDPVAVPVEASLRSVRYGGFINPSEWAAVNVFQSTREVTLELHFQENKPAGIPTFSSSIEVDGKNSIRLEPIKVDSLDSLPSALPLPGAYEIKGNVIRWTIQFPKIGYCYRIDWNW